MKGAITDPCVKTISVPIKTMVIISGANQYFLRTFRKSQMSLTRSRKVSMVQKMRVRSVIVNYLIMGFERYLEYSMLYLCELVFLKKTIKKVANKLLTKRINLKYRNP